MLTVGNGEERTGPTGREVRIRPLTDDDVFERPDLGVWRALAHLENLPLRDDFRAEWIERFRQVLAERRPTGISMSGGRSGLLTVDSSREGLAERMGVLQTMISLVNRDFGDPWERHEAKEREELENQREKQRERALLAGEINRTLRPDDSPE